MNETAEQTDFAVDLHSRDLPKGEGEYQAFLRLLPQLLGTHYGKYVAIHNGQVVDSATDDVTLILRVQAKVGYVPRYIGLVTKSEPVVRIPHYHECRPRGN